MTRIDGFTPFPSSPAPLPTPGVTLPAPATLEDVVADASWAALAGGARAAPAEMTSIALAGEQMALAASGEDPARLRQVGHELWRRFPAAPPALAPGQYELRTRSYAAPSRFGRIDVPGLGSVSFAGDARGPTNRLDVESRITQKTIVDSRDGSVLGTVARSDPSRVVAGPVTLPHERTAQPRAHAAGTREGRGVRVEQAYAGSNPFLPEPGSPDIDVHTSVTLERQGDLLVVRGAMTGDQFPSAELLLTDSAGTTLLLHHYATPHGQLEGPATRLPGDARRDMGRFEVRIRVDPAGRFLGEVR